MEKFGKWETPKPALSHPCSPAIPLHACLVGTNGRKGSGKENIKHRISANAFVSAPQVSAACLWSPCGTYCGVGVRAEDSVFPNDAVQLEGREPGDEDGGG